MKNFRWKIGSSLLTFFIGTVLALFWFASSVKPEKNLETPELQSSESTTPTVTPKLVDVKDRAYLQGEKDARRDIKDGKLTIKVRGITAFAQILETELSTYKIQIQSIGCFFDEKDEKRLRGYNEVSKTAIKERIGADILEKAFQKATEKDGDASQ